MRIDHLARIRLAHLPTPIEHLPRLSRLLGGPEIHVKRDDATGLATGGNKTRKLEFLIADAIESGADTIVTVGAMQSNHARQTAAAAARVGLRCVLILENRHAITDPIYETGGNVLIDRLMNAEIVEVPAGTDLTEALGIEGKRLLGAGRVPYLIPIGGSNPVGALGYVGCAIELLGQADEMDLPISHIVHASASAGTQAGLVAGLAASGSAIPVTGVSAGMPAADLMEAVSEIAVETASLIEEPGSVTSEMIDVDGAWIGPGYGLPSDEMIAAVKMVASTEGLLLDPVYTGKAMAGLIDMIRRGRFARGDNVLFIHTGGVAGLLAYGSVFDPVRRPTVS